MKDPAARTTDESEGFSSICECGHDGREHTIIDKHGNCDECAHAGCGCKCFWPRNYDEETARQHARHAGRRAACD